MTDNTMSFEAALKRLNEIVRHLEQGDMPLEDSLVLFEEGAGLVRLCNERLEAAEQKVRILKNDYLNMPESLPVEVSYDIIQ